MRVTSCSSNHILSHIIFYYCVLKITETFHHIDCKFSFCVIYDITNPNSKTENYTCIQIGFMMSILIMLLQVLEKMLYLPIWHQNAYVSPTHSRPPQIDRGYKIHHWGKFVHQGVPSSSLLFPILQFSQISSYTKDVPPRGASLLLLYPTFWCHIFPTKLWHQIVSITFSLRP